MNEQALTPSDKRHRFPPAIIAHAVWLYCRFALSYRDVAALLAERGGMRQDWDDGGGRGAESSAKAALPAVMRRPSRP